MENEIFMTTRHSSQINKAETSRNWVPHTTTMALVANWVKRSNAQILHWLEERSYQFEPLSWLELLVQYSQPAFKKSQYIVKPDVTQVYAE